MNNEHTVLTGTVHIFGHKNGETIDEVVDIDFPLLCRDWENKTGYDEQDPEIGWNLISSTTKFDYEYTSGLSFVELNTFAREYNKRESQKEKDIFAEEVNVHMDNGNTLSNSIYEINREKSK